MGKTYWEFDGVLTVITNPRMRNFGLFRMRKSIWLKGREEDVNWLNEALKFDRVAGGHLLGHLLLKLETLKKGLRRLKENGEIADYVFMR